MVERATFEPFSWMRELSRRATPDAKLLLWLLIGDVATIVLPLAVFIGARVSNSADSDWAAAAAKGDFQNDDQYGSSNAQSNGNQYNMVQQQQQWNEYENREQKMIDEQNNCVGWFNWKCTDNDASDEISPRWWRIASSALRKTNDEEPITLLLMIYLWTLAMLLYLIFLARRMTIRGDNISEMAGPFLMLVAYSIGGMLFLGGLTGAIRDDGWGVAETGWYGQTGVLLYMTFLCSAILGSVFFVISNQIGGEQTLQQSQTRLAREHENQHYTLQERVKRALYSRNPRY